MLGRLRYFAALFAAIVATGLCCAASKLRAEVQLEELPATMGVADGGVFEGPILEGPYSHGRATYDEPWTWQLMPEGLIYHSYLAGTKEPRLASVFAYVQDHGWVWDFTVGARVGLLRYGTSHAFRPDGWQLDVEGAAFPRLDMEHDLDLVDVDFRGGVPLTYGIGPLQAKLAYYHLSSHLGDEFIKRNPGGGTYWFPVGGGWMSVPLGPRRINYVRDVIVLGGSVYPTDNVRLYGEAGYAFVTDGGSEPWEFQFGAEYSPVFPVGFRGAPFAAINGHLRQEVDFGGSLVVQAGWQWRSVGVGRLLRIGAQYFNGKSDQYQFFRQFEEQIGAAIWYDY